MKPLPKISEAEYEVMKVIWNHAPINTNEITEQLTRTTDWSPKTIQTLIKRLVNKSVLTYEKQSRVFVYTPLFSQKDYIGQESHSFLDRFYNGSMTSMLTAFLDSDQLTDTEIDTLQMLLSRNSKKGGR